VHIYHFDNQLLMATISVGNMEVELKIFKVREAYLGSILLNHFDRNLRIKRNLVKFKFVIMTLHICMDLKYLGVQDYCPQS
jgi:hypothetical protein